MCFSKINEPNVAHFVHKKKARPSFSIQRLKIGKIIVYIDRIFEVKILDALEKKSNILFMMKFRRMDSENLNLFTLKLPG